MRAAMAGALVGDEQQDEDPTVHALRDRVANLLGKKSALFLPSGTMANVAAMMVHCRPGDEILAEASSHLFHFETGGAAGLAGAQTTPLVGEGGIFSAETLAAKLRPPRWNAPRPRLIWIEQTTNMGGGRVWPIDTLDRMRDLAQEHGLSVHMDGARLMNASVAHKVAPAAYGEIADSLWIDFTKGLGAPFGAVLAGSEAFIAGARRAKHMLGGAMRQGGIMAAACLYALDHNVGRLAEDHRRARDLACGLAGISGIEIPNPVETNIVIINTAGTGRSAAELVARLETHGLRVGLFGPDKLRAVTHLGISDKDVEFALQAFIAAAA